MYRSSPLYAAPYDGKDVGVNARLWPRFAHGHPARRRAHLCADEEDLPGTVKLIFQPAEESAPEGEEGGAALMIKKVC